VIKEHLRYPGCFEPATDWDKALARPQPLTTAYPHFDDEGKRVTGGSGPLR
jgi:hypothetical protein